MVTKLIFFIHLRRVWRYQRGNHNPYIEEQTTQWSKEKPQKDKQRSTKHTHKAKCRVTRTWLNTGCELGCSGRVGSSCSTSDTPLVNLSYKTGNVYAVFIFFLLMLSIPWKSGKKWPDKNVFLSRKIMFYIWNRGSGWLTELGS
jgi:hypothetical protein